MTRTEAARSSARTPTTPAVAALLGLVLALHALALRWAPQLPEPRAWLTGGAYVLGMTTCLGVGVLAWRRAHPAQRRTLAPFAAALAVVLLADSTVLGFELRGQTLPDFSAADVLYFGYYLLLAMGLLRLTQLQLGPLRTVTMLLDSLIIMTIVGALAWSALLAGQAQLRWVGTLYVALDLALIGLVLLALRRQRLGWPLGLVTLGLGGIVWADFQYAFVGAYASGTLADRLYLWATALQALGLWLRHASPDDGVQDRAPRAVRVWLAAFPYLAVALVSVLMALSALRQSAPSTPMMWGTALVFVLVMLRQGTVIHENVRLTQDLRRSTAELARSADLLRHQVQHDALTGLPNRVQFEARLGAALAAGERCAVMFIDLDGFKHVNDTFGHPVGDGLLQQVAQRFGRALPPGSTLARVSGDEFTVLLPGPPQAALDLAERLLATLREPLVCAERTLFVTASIGIALAPRDGQDTALLQSRADTAMYHAKASGKNRVSLFTPGLDAQRLARFEIEAALRLALEGGGEFSLHYQPQLDYARGSGAELHGAELRGVEALLRWHSARLGSVAPSTLIPLAEDSGLILPLGRWVRREACRQAAEWHAQGRPLRVAVNVSPLEFTQPDFVAGVAQALEAAGLPAPLLELEITESLYMRDLRDSASKLRELRVLGVRVSVDDFGVGHSALGSLLHLPADALKLDRSFVQAAQGGDLPGTGGQGPAHESSGARQIIAAVRQVSRALGMDLIAEGVETPAQRALLTELGVTWMQGYLLARPMPAPDFERWWAAQRAGGAGPEASLSSGTVRPGGAC